MFYYTVAIGPRYTGGALFYRRHDEEYLQEYTHARPLTDENP